MLIAHVDTTYCKLSDSRVIDRFSSMLQMVQAAGEMNRIQQGLFDNYLESKVKDPRLLLVSHLQPRLCVCCVFLLAGCHSYHYFWLIF